MGGDKKDGGVVKNDLKGCCIERKLNDSFCSLD